MYQWQRIMRDARHFRALRVRRLRAPENDWLTDYEAGRELIFGLTGGAEKVLDFEPLREAVPELVAAIRKVFAEKNIDERVFAGSLSRIRALLEERRDEGRERKADYVDRVLTSVKPAVRDVVVLARQSILIDLIRHLVADEELAAEETMFGGDVMVDIAGGRVRRVRQPAKDLGATGRRGDITAAPAKAAE